MSKMIKNLLPGLNSILKVRDDIGAIREQPIYIITRKWSGVSPGDGLSEDTEEKVYPSPGIRDHSHDVRLMSGGTMKQGDLILRNLSKASYPDRKSIDGSSDAKNEEKFFKVGDFVYTVVNIKENHLTWDIQVRRHAN